MGIYIPCHNILGNKIYCHRQFVAMNYRKYDKNKIYKTNYNASSGTNAILQGIHLNTDVIYVPQGTIATCFLNKGNNMKTNVINMEH